MRYRHRGEVRVPFEFPTAGAQVSAERVQISKLGFFFTRGDFSGPSCAHPHEPLDLAQAASFN